MNDETWNGVPLAAIGSGLIPEPPQGRTYPPQINLDDPFERAAYRQQQSVRPAFGRAGEGPSIEGIVRTAVPGADLVLTARENATNRRGGQQLPLGSGRKSGQNTGQSLAEILGATPAHGAEDPNAPKAQSIDAAFGEPQPQRPSEVQAEIKRINTELGPKQTQLDRLKGLYEAKRISEQDYNRRRVPLEQQIERSKGQITEIDSPYQRELSAWETRKNEFLTGQSTAKQQLAAKRANAELPFRIKHPEATKDIVTGGGALTGLTAVTLGALSRGKLKPSLAAGGIGAAEGALTANAPELLDLSGFQPRGGEAWNKTLNQMLGKESLVATGADALLHGGGAMAGSYATSLGPKVYGRIRENITNMRSPTPQPRPPGPAIPPARPNAPLTELGGSAGTPPQAPGASPAPSSGSPTVFTRGGQTFALTPDGRVLLQSGSGWHGPDGKWIKKSDWPTLGSLGQNSP